MGWTLLTLQVSYTITNPLEMLSWGHQCWLDVIIILLNNNVWNSYWRCLSCDDRRHRTCDWGPCWWGGVRVGVGSSLLYSILRMTKTTVVALSESMMITSIAEFGIVGVGGAHWVPCPGLGVWRCCGGCHLCWRPHGSIRHPITTYWGVGGGSHPYLPP